MAPELDPVSRVLDTLGHDLRGPLFTARGYIQLVQSRSDDERLRRLADEAVASLDEAARMVDGVLAWARTESHRLSQGDVALDDVLKQVLEHVPGAAGRVDARPLPVVRGDLRALRYALQHLLENALAYGPADGQVVVEGGRQGSRWWLRVTDGGAGVEDTPELRRPFWEVSNRRKGAGIALADKVAKAHRGQLILRKGDGTFSATLEGQDG